MKVLILSCNTGQGHNAAGRAVQEEFLRRGADCRMLDLTKSGLYNDTPSTHGIFQDDGIHYLPEAHRYFAERQWEDLFGNKG